MAKLSFSFIGTSVPRYSNKTKTLHSSRLIPGAGTPGYLRMSLRDKTGCGPPRRGRIGLHAGCWRELFGRGDLGVRHAYTAQREPVRAHPVPFLNHDSVGFEERTDARALPSRDVFENRSEDGEGAGAKNSSLGDLRHVLSFRDGNGLSVTDIGVQHHVNVGTSVAAINDVVRADLSPVLQLIEDEHFSIARGGASNGFNLTGFFVEEF